MSNRRAEQLSEEYLKQTKREYGRFEDVTSLKADFKAGYDAGQADGEVSGRIKGITEVITYLDSEEVKHLDQELKSAGIRIWISAVTEMLREKFEVKE